MKNKKIIVIIVSIISLLIICTGGYFIYDKVLNEDVIKNDNNNKNNEEKNEETQIKNYNTGNLDINSDILKGLVYPQSNDYAFIYSISGGYLTWNYKDIDLFNYGRKHMMWAASSFHPQKSGYEFINIECNCFYVPAEDVRVSFMKIFGPDVEYTDYDVENSKCGSIGEFVSEKNAYIMRWGCGGGPGTGYEWDNKIKLYKAEQTNEEIYTYFYVQPYLTISHDITFNDGKNYVYLYNRKLSVLDEFIDAKTSDYYACNYSNPCIAKNYTEEVQKDNLDSVINSKLVKGEISTYKFTFKKASDGSYYFYSGNWE